MNTAPDEKPCLLLTSTGSRAAEAILASLAALRPHLHVVGLNSNAFAPSLYDVDVAYLGPETKDEDAYSDRVREIIAREKASVVLPGRDEEIPLLAKMAEACWADGVNFLIPPESIARVFNDKYRTSQFALEHNLPFVKTAWTGEELSLLIAEQRFPLVAKPRTGGHASRGVRIVFNDAEAHSLHARGTHIFQSFVGLDLVEDALEDLRDGCGLPWIWNPANTTHYIDIVFGKGGEALSQSTIVGRRNGSIVQEPSISNDPALLSAAALHIEVFRDTGMKGPLNIQGAIDSDGVFRAFEWNARFHGSIQSNAILGTNLVGILLRHFIPRLQGVEEPILPPSRAFRRLHYRSIPNEWSEKLSGDGRFEID